MSLDAALKVPPKGGGANSARSRATVNKAGHTGSLRGSKSNDTIDFSKTINGLSSNTDASMLKVNLDCIFHIKKKNSHHQYVRSGSQYGEEKNVDMIRSQKIRRGEVRRSMSGWAGVGNALYFELIR